jgi:membrane-associated protease RseP (regulator of RpoE activity)
LLKAAQRRVADLVPETEGNPTLVRHTYTGLEHAEMFVAHVDPGSPADSAGLKPGDLIVALDDKPISHWIDLDQRLQAEPSKTYKLTWRRATTDGKTELLSAELTQVQRQELDGYGHTITRLVFGARNDVDRGRGAMTPIEGRFGYAASKALERTGDTITTMISGFLILPVCRRVRVSNSSSMVPKPPGKTAMALARYRNQNLRMKK